MSRRAKDISKRIKSFGDEVKETRFQLVEPEGRVLESPGTNLRFIRKCFRASEK